LNVRSSLQETGKTHIYILYTALVAVMFIDLLQYIIYKR
jgi:hypothetical protein